MAPTIPPPYSEVIFADFEYVAPAGERPDPFCLVFHEAGSGATHTLWRDELYSLQEAPFGVGKDTLFVCFYGPAEMGCFAALGWKMPENVLDLYAESRVITNGVPPVHGDGLLGVLAHFGLNASMTLTDKSEMIRRILTRPLVSAEDIAEVKAYCRQDVLALPPLLLAMLPRLDLRYAVVRGDYTKSVALMEHQGVPIDYELWGNLRHHWPKIRLQLIQQVDAAYGVYDNGSFREERFRRLLQSRSIPWPRLPSGRLALDRDTFGDMARLYPGLTVLHQLRTTLGQLREPNLAIGSDGRNRSMLSAFGTRTGRNRPSSSENIFGLSSWLRGLICPAARFGLANVDYSAAEFGIAAALSGDRQMIAAYESGAPYMAVARLLGAASPEATRRTHPAVRERYKVVALALLYGMGPTTLASRLGCGVAEARYLIDRYMRAFPTFAAWSQAAIDRGQLLGGLHTPLGWSLRTSEATRPTTLKNFPVQGAGADILRLACILTHDAGVAICAPIHDALLIEAPLPDLEQAVATTRRTMTEASGIVLKGLKLRTDAKLTRYPDRYLDPRGREIWTTTTRLLGALLP